MPRKARSKDPLAIYHVMCRSISELLLFACDEDKDYYLLLLKRYLSKYHCSLYAYCLMDNHLHLQIDPKGFDISTFMHSVNTAYVRYYNKKYNRHGHLFQDRFQSRILSTDEYNLSVSAYIHNNPHDIESFSGREETYEYSSYGIYLGIVPDRYGLVETCFIQGLFGLPSHKLFTKRYHEFVRSRLNNQENEEMQIIKPMDAEYEYVSGRNVIIRERPVNDIISFISRKLKIHQHTGLKTKSRRQLTDYRAFTAYVLRVLCNLSYRDICKHIMNITITSCSRLCSYGYELTNNSDKHLKIFNELAASAA